MTENPIEQRIADIGTGLEQIRGGWPFISAEIERYVTDKIESLVNKEDEQTRGQIKALRWVLSLPSDLSQERDGLRSALSDEDAGV